MGPRTKRGVTTFNCLSKHWLVLHQLAAHPPPLRTLTAHDEANTRWLFSASGKTRAALGRFLALRECIKRFRQFVPVTGDEGKPMRVVISSDSKSVSQIRKNG